jgi:hypothetical protein
LFSSLARWTAGDTANLPGNMLVTQEVKNGISTIQLHLDPDRDDRPNSSSQLSALPKVTTLRGKPGSKPTSDKTEMRWASADTLEVPIPLNGSETALSTVDIPGAQPITLAPVTLPYSPEFKPASAGTNANEGQTALDRLATATGGKERLELSGVWRDLPRQLRLIELAPYLLLLAIALLLVEVLERHTGLITARVFPLWPIWQTADRRWRRKAISQPTSASVKTPVAEITPSATSEQKEENGSENSGEQAAPAAIFGALKKARQKAEERTKR